MTPAQVWAERVLVEHELGSRIFLQTPERYIDSGDYTDRTWLRERLRRLQARARDTKGRAA